MIQLGFSFGIIFHQTRAKVAKIRLIAFIIGFITFITTGLIVMAVVSDEEELEKGIIALSAKFCLDLGIAV